MNENNFSPSSVSLYNLRSLSPRLSQNLVSSVYQQSLSPIIDYQRA